MYEIEQVHGVEDTCWRARFWSPAEVSEALRLAAAHPVDGGLTHYMDVRGHDSRGELVVRIIPVLHIA